jgi:hypothetical protein
MEGFVLGFICMLLVIHTSHCLQDTPQRRLNINEQCASILATQEKLNSASRTIIFRCRPGDNCGGIGDRLGGVMAGAFYAMEQGRSFRIFWPGWDSVFNIGKSNWTYDPRSLGINILGADGEEIDKTREQNIDGGEIYPMFEGRTDVGVVNDLNTRQILNQTLFPQIEKFQHIFFHSNRGPDKDLYLRLVKKYNWVMDTNNQDSSYYEAYRCVFEGMFRPSQEFLESPYKGIHTTSSVPFSRIISIAKNPEFISMAYHHRVDDNTASSNSNFEIISASEINTMITISEKHRAMNNNKPMNLFFITNSNASSYLIKSDSRVKSAFQSVHCQDLAGQIHVNDIDYANKKLNEASEKVILSTRQAMRDWWLMRLVDILLFPTSGFSKSAALMAPQSQFKYEDNGNALRTQPWTICGNRFC